MSLSRPASKAPIQDVGNGVLSGKRPLKGIKPENTQYKLFKKTLDAMQAAHDAEKVDAMDADDADVDFKEDGRLKVNYKNVLAEGKIEQEDETNLSWSLPDRSINSAWNDDVTKALKKLGSMTKPPLVESRMEASNNKDPRYPMVRTNPYYCYRHGEAQFDFSEAKIRRGWDRAKESIKRHEKDLVFRLADITYTTSPANGLSIQIMGNTKGEDSASICVNVYGFRPYFFIKKPESWGDGYEAEDALKAFKDHLNKRVKKECELMCKEDKNRDKTKGGKTAEAKSFNPKIYENFKNLVTDVKIVNGDDMRNGFKLNSDGKTPFLTDMLQIVLAYPELVTVVRRMVENGKLGKWLPENLKADDFPTETYESDIPFKSRFMADKNFSGDEWLVVRKNSYEVVSEEKCTAYTDVEVRVNEENIMKYSEYSAEIKKKAKEEAEALGLPPPPEADDNNPKEGDRIVLSYDIEVDNLGTGLFPEAEEAKFPVKQIGVTLYEEGKKKETQKNYAFVMGTCPENPKVVTFRYEEEAHLLRDFRRFLMMADPDTIMGYNQKNFDDVTLINRAKNLLIANRSEWAEWGSMHKNTKNNGNLKAPKDLSFLADFPYMTRLMDRKCRVIRSVVTTRAKGTVVSNVTNFDGRDSVDILLVIQSNYKLRSYKLGDVGEKFVGDTKEDVPHYMISPMQKNHDDRGRLRDYCWKDSFLPTEISDKLLAILNLSKAAEVNHMVVNDILFRGLTARIKVNVYWYSKHLPVRRFVPTRTEAERNSSQGHYEGAVVQKAMRGFYGMKGNFQKVQVRDPETGLPKVIVTDKMPVSTEDFASLYPSIMLWINICPSTFASEEYLQSLGFKEGEDYMKTFISRDPRTGEEVTSCYVTTKHKQGTFPAILRILLGNRSASKRMMNTYKTKYMESGDQALYKLVDEAETEQDKLSQGNDKKAFDEAKKKYDDLMKKYMSTCNHNLGQMSKVFDAKQNEEKKGANAMYGALGAVTSFMYHPISAATVTARGRAMITLVAQALVDRFNIANGYPCNVSIIYGDTDSVFVLQPGMNIKEAMAMGQEMAKFINDSGFFGKDVQLTFEKTWEKLILWSKKKYHGRMWMYKPDQKKYPGGIYPLVKSAGIETSRRDNCMFVVNTLKDILNTLLSDSIEDVKKTSLDIAKKKVSQLLQEDVSFDELIISGALSRPINEYKTRNFSSNLAEAMNRRAKCDAIRPGMRFNYVVVEKDCKNISECSEDPLYAWENKLRLNLNYYLHGAYRKSILRLFEPILCPELDPKDPQQKKEIDRTISREIFEGEHTRHVTIRYQEEMDDTFSDMVQRALYCCKCQVGLDKTKVLSSIFGRPRTMRPEDEGEDAWSINYEDNVRMCDKCFENGGYKAYRDSMLKKLEGLEIESLAQNAKCQKCVGNQVSREILCARDGCNHLWKSKKTKRDIEEVEKKLRDIGWFSESSLLQKKPSPPASPVNETKGSENDDQEGASKVEQPSKKSSGFNFAGATRVVANEPKPNNKRARKILDWPSSKNASPTGSKKPRTEEEHDTRLDEHESPLISMGTSSMIVDQEEEERYGGKTKTKGEGESTQKKARVTPSSQETTQSTRQPYTNSSGTDQEETGHTLTPPPPQATVARKTSLDFSSSVQRVSIQGGSVRRFGPTGSKSGPGSRRVVTNANAMEIEDSSNNDALRGLASRRAAASEPKINPTRTIPAFFGARTQKD